MKAKITKRLVDGLEPGSFDRTIFDSEIPGSPFGSANRRHVLCGRIQSWPRARRVDAAGDNRPRRQDTPDEARAAARKVLGSVAHGEDPAAEKASDVVPAPWRGHRCFLAGACRGEAQSLHRGVDARRVERIVRFWLNQAGRITRQDADRLHWSMRSAGSTVGAGNPGCALFLGRQKRLCRGGHNPARGVEKFPERSRERFLTNEEFARLADALRQGETSACPIQSTRRSPTQNTPQAGCTPDQAHPFAIAAIRLLILTGARLREILHAKWDYVDFERGVMFLPDSKTGKKPIYLPPPHSRS